MCGVGVILWTVTRTAKAYDRNELGFFFFPGVNAAFQSRRTRKGKKTPFTSCAIEIAILILLSFCH